MNQNKKIILICVLLLGLIVPFTPSLIVIEIFFLIIPFAIIFVVTLIFLAISLLKKQINSRKALFAFSILPTFLIAQLLSGFSVDKIQRLRSNKIITDLKQIKNETGSFPEQYELAAGITYTRLKNKEHFKLEYSRGFMATEKYYSDIGNWKSYGWND